MIKEQTIDFIRNFLQSLDAELSKFEGIGLISDEDIEKFLNEIKELEDGS